MRKSLLPIITIVVWAAADVSTVHAAANDYSAEQSWLCRPGRQDACAVDLTTTVVKANGELSRETWQANPRAPIDCFYVYPTVSTDTADNSDMTADPAERNVIRAQLARFGSQCRLFAPLYRQITLVGLRKVMAAPDGLTGLGRGMAYDDVLDAWRYYLEHDNSGRGFVLIGHSQGAFILTELIKNEIDGKPIQARMVSAILLGATVPVAKGKDVGGAFQRVPLCHGADQIGCVVTYASYRSTLPPPANALFGRVTDAGQVAGCTNPAALGGGHGELHSYLAADGQNIANRQTVKPWVTPAQPISTPWVSVPGLLTAACASNENASGYLEVTVHGVPSDPRVDDIAGDLGFGNQIQANWGLHLIDVDLAVGNLLDILGGQAKAYAQKAR